MRERERNERGGVRERVTREGGIRDRGNERGVVRDRGMRERERGMDRGKESEVVRGE